jgi:hypothetical protein
MTKAKPSPTHGCQSFDIHSLESEELTKLLVETSPYVKGINIEIVHKRKYSRSDEAHPASIVGVDVHKPTIRFVDCLDRQQRIEAIAHELGHLILLYRFGLRLILRRRPRRGDRDDVFRYFISMNRDLVLPSEPDWQYHTSSLLN